MKLFQTKELDCFGWVIARQVIVIIKNEVTDTITDIRLVSVPL